MNDEGEWNSSQFCLSGTCSWWEHCCGNNLCCGNRLILFQVVLLSALVVSLFLCCGVILICRFARRMMSLNDNNDNRNLFTGRNDSTTNLVTARDMEYDDRIYSDPPPPYSEFEQIS